MGHAHAALRPLNSSAARRCRCPVFVVWLGRRRQHAHGLAPHAQPRPAAGRLRCGVRGFPSPCPEAFDPSRTWALRDASRLKRKGCFDFCLSVLLEHCVPETLHLCHNTKHVLAFLIVGLHYGPLEQAIPISWGRIRLNNAKVAVSISYLDDSSFEFHFEFLGFIM